MKYAIGYLALFAVVFLVGQTQDRVDTPFTSNSVQAQDIPVSADPGAPEAVINGPVTGVPGEILYLDASSSLNNPTHFRWMVEPKIKGRVQIDPTEANSPRIQIASFPGRYRYTLVVSNSAGADILYWEVYIPGSPPPQPTPGPLPPGPLPPEPEPQPEPEPGPTPPPIPPKPPEPTPPPEPDVPKPPSEGEFNVAIPSYEAAMAVVSPKYEEERSGLHEGLQSVSSAISAGGLNSAQEIVTAMLEGSKRVLGSNPPKGWIAWGDIVSAKLKQLYFSGKMKNSDQWSTFIDEVASGLKAAKK